MTFHHYDFSLQQTTVEIMTFSLQQTMVAAVHCFPSSLSIFITIDSLLVVVTTMEPAKEICTVSNKIFCKWNFEWLGNNEKGCPIYWCKNCQHGSIVGNTTGYKNLLFNLSTDNCFGTTFFNVKDPRFRDGMKPAWERYWEHCRAEKDGKSNVFERMVNPKVQTIYD